MELEQKKSIDILNKDSETLKILADYALANTIFAGYKLGFFEPFLENLENSSLDLNKVFNNSNWNYRIIKGIAEHLTHRNVFKKSDKNANIFLLDNLGEHLIKNGWFSYLIFFVGGYGEVLLKSEEIGKNELIYGENINRNSDWVAKGTELMSKTQHHRSYSTILKNSERNSSNNVLDIGCGTAKFLTELVKCSNSQIGVGIDISKEACDIAQKNIAQSSDINRIEIVNGDFLNSVSILKEKYKNFDIITALMILHEYIFYGEEILIKVLTSIRELLSTNGSFLLLDKITDELPSSPLYFTEYKLIHDLTNQDLYSFSDWENILNKSGLRIKESFKLPKHTGSVLFECVSQ